MAGRREPSTAEYLDTVRACLQLGETPDSPRWKAIELAAMTKHTPADGRRA
jgi:hypothetical protein